MSDHSSYDNVEKSEAAVAPLPESETTKTSTTPANAIISSITTNAPSVASDKEPLSVGRQNLQMWLGKTFRVVITDGRVLVGFFNCTDKDANVVLSMCAEYLEEGKDARILGNVMIPGKHIVSISVDTPKDETTCSHRNALREIEIQQVA